MLSSQPASRRFELVLFFGSLVLHIVNALVFDRPDMIWDEARYSWFANNMTQGFYTTAEKADIINGPGYPLVLAPLMALHVPLLGQRMVNALFLAFAAWFTFRAVLPYAGRRWALGVALILVFHPALVRRVPWLMTEALTCCCIAGFAWAFSAALRSEKWRWGTIVTAAAAFGYLTLTRVFFGNVIMAMLFFLTLMLLWKSQREKVLRAIVVMGLSFVICIPWLAFTHAKTGNLLCWSTNGGELLYWATSTQNGENGHWFSDDDVKKMPEHIANGHRDFYLKNYYLPIPQREEAFKQQAMANLRANPQGALSNWLCNWSRLAFGFPRSHQAEELRSNVLIASNGPILILVLLTVFVGWRIRRIIPVEILLLSLIAFIYLGGTSLLPGQPRYLVVIQPWVGLVVASVLQRGLRIQLGPLKE